MESCFGALMDLPKSLIALGLLLVALGALAWFLQRYPWLYSWFGNLPGDIRYEGSSGVVFAPLASMLLISAFLSGIGWLVRKFLG